MTFTSRKALLLATGLFSTALAIQIPNAQAQSFTPASPWAFNVITSQNGEKICHASSEYNNGYIVTLRAKEDSDIGLSVNFRQNIFDVAQPYSMEIALDNRLYNASAQAESTSTLAATLPANASIFSGAQNANTLEIGVAGNSFKFDLAGFSSAYNGFSKCVQSAPAPMAAPAPVAQQAPVAMDAAPLRMNTAAVPSMNSSALPDLGIDTKSRPSGNRQRYTEMLAEKMGATPTDLLPKERRFNVNAPSIALAPSMATPPSSADLETPTFELQAAAETNAMPAQPTEPVIKVEVMDAPKLPEIKVKETKSISTPLTITKETETITADFTEAKLSPARKSRVFVNTDLDVPVTSMKSTPKPVGPSAAEKRMQHDLARLEQELHSLKTENSQLQNELDMSLNEAQDETISITTDNWDLERATMRYNEAERQIKRLGQQIQKERARCTAQLKELEMMLFDPQLTEKQQLATLAELEEKLFEAEEKLSIQRRRYEERIQLLEGQLRGE